MPKVLLIILVFGLQILNAQSFLKQQQQFSRFKVAEKENKLTTTSRLSKFGVYSSNLNVLLEVFKKEQKLNVYVSDGKTPYQLYKTFDFCTFSGILGPKCQEGDGQIPEGIYQIRDFNPWSSFYLSMGINYPNKIDKKRATDLGYPSAGSNIYIHGSCVSIGCVSISDQIKELYYLCVLAKNNNQNTIPVYMFPFDFSDPENSNYLSKKHPQLWDDLNSIYQKWNADKLAPMVHFIKNGRYSLHLPK